ncbi:response regulator transcription factor [Bradyrhizobium prioriisuperbiae]|uniref:response regulator transcription factor n=1 Tax=Bradyrhizobium prioriisuperbiae TaxID=2854389 RepID=UPI0028EAD1CA|nr:response regulator [Bradyrhizobium prioritasuperba]
MAQKLPFSVDVPIFIVDDDSSVRDALSLLLKIEGFLPRGFGDGFSFLEAVQEAVPACVVLDINLPGRSGLEVLDDLSRLKFPPPVIVITGQADIAMAVAAMKSGARDVLEKPFAANVLIDRIRDVVAAHHRLTNGYIEGLANFPGRELLTSRERDVLSQVARGASNKEAGRRLGISPRTIEVHRARIMDKLGAKNAADLMRIVLSESTPRSRSSSG